ncbi:MAG: MBL fold metallo-hydrolase [Dehalococcoidales bacterium]|nr:MBL fold metallo-hydrolase [Dehalococcoidales bacterium]
MAEVKEVAEGIYQVGMAELRSSRGVRTSSPYLIADDRMAIVDIGPSVVVPPTVEAIRQLGYESLPLAYLILTHIHLDHAGGAGALAEQFPGLEVVVHQRGARHLIEPSRLIEGTRRAYGEKFEDDYGPILPVPERQVRAVEEGDVIPLGGRELKVIYTPGHAPHEISLYDTKSKGIFCADVIGTTEGTNLWADPGFDHNAALESIDKVSKLEPKLFFRPHGVLTGEEVTGLIKADRALVTAYGDIMLEALKAGEERGEIEARLKAYQKEHAPSEIPRGEYRLNNVIRGYTAYFKRQGII